MVGLTILHENRVKQAHIYKRENYLNLAKELKLASYKDAVMPRGPSAYDFLTKLSTCDNKRTKALKLLPEKLKIVHARPGAGNMRGSFIQIKKCSNSRETCCIVWFRSGIVPGSAIHPRRQCWFESGAFNFLSHFADSCRKYIFPL